MRKFKKFLAAAMTGAMMFGSVAMAAPAVSVYAEQYDYIVVADKTEVVQGTETIINLSAGEEGTTVGVIGEDKTHQTTFTSSDTTNTEVTNTTTAGQKATIKIKATAPEGEITVTAKKGSSTATVTITIKKATTPSGPSGEPADSGITDTTLSYTNMTLTVETDAPYFTVDVVKSESEKAKPSKSYTYANDGDNVIDLGFLKIKKGNILNIYASTQPDKTKGKTVKIAEQPAKEKFTVDATKTTLAEALNKKDAEAKLYQYRSSFGSNWYELENLDFENAKVAGTTIVVRLKAVDEGDNASPAGPEAKVKIAAAPKAPKVTVDYMKDNVKVTDKMQIALLEDGAIEEKAWKTAKKGMTRSDLVKELGIETADAANAFTIVVRTAASGKKSASMPVIVPIKATPVLEKAEDGKSATCTVDGKPATISAKMDDKGAVTFTTPGGDFQYEVSGKWKAVPDKPVKGVADTVKVRLAPEKENKSVANSGSFASNDVEIKVEKPVTAKVEKVEVSPATKEITFASAAVTEKFTATVTPVSGVTLTDAEKEVTWSIKSATLADGTTAATGVTISGDTLTIAADSNVDNGAKIIVVATSKTDSKTAEATITIKK